MATQVVTESVAATAARSKAAWQAARKAGAEMDAEERDAKRRKMERDRKRLAAELGAGQARLQASLKFYGQLTWLFFERSS